MRSSGSRVRECGRRGGCLAASLIALAACGDNLPGPRLTTAFYEFDVGGFQLDRHTLYDRELATLCEPTRFSDGAMYCMPPADNAFYTDEKCQHAIVRVPSGESPRAFAATTFGLHGELSASRVYRTGAATDPPAQRWERRDNLCVAMPLDDGYDYYAAAAELSNLAPVHIRVAGVSEGWQFTYLTGDGVSLPWGLLDSVYGDCEVVSRPLAKATSCHPTDSVRINYYEDSNCTMPIAIVPSRPRLAYTGTEQCLSYSAVGVEAVTGNVYQLFNGSCIESAIPTPANGFLVGEPVRLGVLSRARSEFGGRIHTIHLAPTPLDDDLLYDAQLDVDCRRDANGLCVPVTDVKVETWFTDAQCSQSIDVAMVANPCNLPIRYARRENTYYRIGAPNAEQLFQLSTGDTCQPYNPPVPFVAYSVGPALGDDAFARATLMVE